jgi:plasmid maintenance system killer protein
MRAILPEPFVQQLLKAPSDIQRRFLKQLAYLLRDLNHPGLHAKKYDEARDIWQARVNGGWRLYFRIEGDTYVLESIRSHPK